MKTGTYDPKMWCVSYPRSGRHWTYCVAWHVYSNQSVPGDKTIYNMPEISRWASTHDGAGAWARKFFRSRATCGHKRLRKRDERRYAGGTVAHIVRDPRDSVPSLWYFMKYRQGNKNVGTFADFVRSYLGIEHCVWFLNHWAKKCATCDRYMVTRYEDLCARPVDEFVRLLQFFDPSVARASVERAVASCGVTQMRAWGAAQFGRDDNRANAARYGRPGGHWRDDAVSDRDRAFMERVINQNLSDAYEFYKADAAGGDSRGGT